MRRIEALASASAFFYLLYCCSIARASPTCSYRPRCPHFHLLYHDCPHELTPSNRSKGSYHRSPVISTHDTRDDITAVTWSPADHWSLTRWEVAGPDVEQQCRTFDLQVSHTRYFVTSGYHGQFMCLILRTPPQGVSFILPSPPRVGPLTTLCRLTDVQLDTTRCFGLDLSRCSKPRV